MTIVGTSGLVLNEKLLFEHSDPGRKGYSLPKLDVPAASLPANLCREEITDFPELSEVDVVRQHAAPGGRAAGLDGLRIQVPGADGQIRCVQALAPPEKIPRGIRGSPPGVDG